MSKGFGKVQKKVIAYLEEHYIAIPSEIINSIAIHEPPSKSEKNSIYRAIKRLKNRREKPNNPESPGIIVNAKQKMLNPPNRPKSQIGKNIRLNKKHPVYIAFKERRTDT